ncbi:hypothetical protein ACWD3I_27210 [Streptomyces sp. NPDC002817]|uniref:hypothetical protein n=1 Tax=Streptomyces sp. NPDC088357 TaxID=3154655 RepID=UPI00342DBA4C
MLEHAVRRAELPDEPLRCGPTWISTGQLGFAERVLGRTVRRMAGHLRQGGLVVGLEPSRTTVFRSDGGDLRSGAPDVRRLHARTVTRAELLRAGARPGALQPARGPRPVRRPRPTPPHLDVNEACAERVPPPRLREADAGTAVPADGFGCGRQIHEFDSGGHEAVHPAELPARGLPGRAGSAYGVAETPHVRPPEAGRR